MISLSKLSNHNCLISEKCMFMDEHIYTCENVLVNNILTGQGIHVCVCV